VSVWHADLNTPALVVGSHVNVFGDHQAVRVLTADQLSIATLGGQRLSAIVLDRTGAVITLSVAAGVPVSLSIVAQGQFAGSSRGAQTSHQEWVVN
jgi:hypothetical protein